jgi:hypothetical protein
VLSDTLRVVRLKRGAPSAASSSAMLREIDERGTRSLRAASAKVGLSAAMTNGSRRFRSIVANTATVCSRKPP